MHHTPPPSPATNSRRSKVKHRSQPLPVMWMEMHHLPPSYTTVCLLGSSSNHILQVSLASVSLITSAIPTFSHSVSYPLNVPPFHPAILALGDLCILGSLHTLGNVRIPQCLISVRFSRSPIDSDSLAGCRSL